MASQSVTISVYSGAIDGFKGPSVKASSLPIAQLWEGIPATFKLPLAEILGLSVADIPVVFQGDEKPIEFFEFIARLYDCLLGAATLAVSDASTTATSDGQIIALSLPTTARASSIAIDYLRWSLKLLELSGSNKETEHLKRLERILERLRKNSAEGSNSYRLLKCAHELSIPAVDFLPSVQIYGQGCRSIWMSSTLTHNAGVTSVNVARNKRYTNYILQTLGFPVAKQSIAKTLEQAKQLAQELGYPVVLKPKSLDGGVGVTPDIRREQGLELAFKEVMQCSKEAIIEKHFEGKDYRITVFQGDALGAVERVPGSVVGDGHKSIKELIDRVNLDPRRGDAIHLPLRRLTVDNEMRLVLAKQNLTIESIPKSGQIIRLRKTANINSGGFPLNATDKMHPDNAALAVRAAQALRLDLAGIDLLIPDISRSWRDSGAVICEVNAQPTIGSVVSSHLYPIILRKTIPGNGRIPVMVSLGQIGWAERATLASLLSKNGLTLGFANNVTIEVAGCVVEDHFADSPLSLSKRATAILRNSSVSVALIELETPKDLEQGLPFDQIDIILRGNGAKEHVETEYWDSVEDNLHFYLRRNCLRTDGADLALLVEKLIQLDHECSQPLTL